MAFLDKNHPQISHVRQCGILSVSRSSTYYKPKVQMPGTVDFLNEIRETWRLILFTATVVFMLICVGKA